MSKLLFKLMPWVIVVILLATLFITNDPIHMQIGRKKSNSSVMLKKIEGLGKIELVKYDFQEITEFLKEGDNLDLKIFKIPIYNDARALLISYGSAVGCMDLSQVQSEDVEITQDTLYIDLPAPEICYFKIDLDRSKIYDMDTKYLTDEERKMFITELYALAEEEIKQSALDAEILSQTNTNARLFLGPILETITNKQIVLKTKVQLGNLTYE